MIPHGCKRLAEVDFPIAAVSKHSAREKFIRHGHPSTLHLWWARRPLAACRAVLLGLLLPDPCDAACPDEFKQSAREALRSIPGVGGTTNDAALQKALLSFIGDFANWDFASEPVYLVAARSLVHAAHGMEPPLVVDPFAGGGSIPLEALRLGCDTFASDLNPVACLIQKVLLEDIPGHAMALADELRQAGEETKTAASDELQRFYPADPDGARPIAYLWARTVRCETPNCGAEIPLVRSLWLSKKANRKCALRPIISRDGPVPIVEFDIFTPGRDTDVSSGTVSRAKATCPCCRMTLPAERVCAQLAEQHGGADAIFDVMGNRIGGARLLAVVTLKDGISGRRYRLPNACDYDIVLKAQRVVESLPIGVVPNEPLPPIGTLGFRVQRYGMLAWGDLFTARQKLTLVTFVDRASRIRNTRNLIGLNLSHITERNNSLCRWYPDAYMETVGTVYGRQALPIVWDFAEAVPLVDSSGGWDHSLRFVIRAVEMAGTFLTYPGQIQLADATRHPLPDEMATIWFTDPPYYDAIPYSDLSDFFFVWLKRALPSHPLLRDASDPSNPLTPKQAEIVQDETRSVSGGVKDRDFFEREMARAFTEGRRVLAENGIGCVVFAHKTTEGWEALLSGMLQAGWVITASWPITTEMSSRLRARESAALATSVHLVCRPRPDDAPVGGWEDILRALPRRIDEWIARLESEHIRGADLVFSCIGPAMELFSRHPRVETADGDEVGLAPNLSSSSKAAQRGFLSYVWEAVGRAALRQVLGQAEGMAVNGSAAAALEEDARLTALFLWTLQSSNGNNVQRAEDDAVNGTDEENGEEEGMRRSRSQGFTLVFDIVRRFAQPLIIHLEEWEGRIIETEKGIVRLLSVRERAMQLFGQEGAAALSRTITEDVARNPQLTLFPEEERQAVPPTVRGRAARMQEHTRRGPTTLDRVHAAMLLQAGGQSAALRAMLADELDRNPDFFRLANALSALYPKESEEKRLVDAMLLAVPRR